MLHPAWQETVERIQKEAGEGIDKAKTELSEYAGEITRLEKELEQSQKITTETEKRLSATTTQISELTTQNTALETHLSDRDNELVNWWNYFIYVHIL